MLYTLTFVIVNILQVSDPWFWPFSIVFVSSHLQHLYEVLSSDESIKTWWNEMRIWIIRAVSACLFGFVDALMKKIGIQKASFRLTNKVVDKEKMDKYNKGKFDFQGVAVFMIPLVILVTLNLVSLMVGLKRVISNYNWDEMFGQLFLSSLHLLLGYPILEGMVTKLVNKVLDYFSFFDVFVDYFGLYH